MARHGLTGERLFALFLLGALLFTPPWLGVFDRPRLVAGIPLLYLYLFVAWGLLILLMALVTETAEDSETAQTQRPLATNGDDEMDEQLAERRRDDRRG
jgi:hypothetical protein